MKRVTTVAIALLLASAFCLLPAKANDTESFNLGWWAAMDDNQQFTAVEAAVNAYQSAYNDGFVAAAVSDRLHYNSTRTSQQLGKDPRSTVVFSKPFVEYQKEVSQFYNDFPDARSTTSLGDIMACLSDKPQFTCAQVAKINS
jgi:hypothetical protein